MKIFSCVIPLEKRTKHLVLFEKPITNHKKIKYFSKYKFIKVHGLIGLRKYDEELDQDFERISKDKNIDWIYDSYISEMLITVEKKPLKIIFIQYDGLENKKINVESYVIFETKDLNLKNISDNLDDIFYINRSEDFAFIIQRL
ncbi:MAG: hypothetical protein QXF12_02170 [Candidatus Aenigmatarchaeota archaeon]